MCEKEEGSILEHDGKLCKEVVIVTVNAFVFLDFGPPITVNSTSVAVAVS